MGKTKSTVQITLKPYTPISVRPQDLLDIDQRNLEEMSYEELVTMGESAVEVKGYSQWILGKLGCAVAQKYHGAVQKYSSTINLAYSSLVQYMFVYRRFIESNPDFSPEKYFGTVPWGMLQIVAGRKSIKEPAKELENLLDAGINTLEGTYRAIKTKETGNSIPSKPKLQLKWNPEIEKWDLKITLEEVSLINWASIPNDCLNEMLTYLNLNNPKV